MATWEERERATSARLFSEKAYKAADGFWRWKTTASIPFDDVLEAAGMSAEERARHKAKRAEETAAFVAEYRKAQKGRRVSAEERAEMRAAFGRGTTVVNILTGRKTRL